MQTPSIGRHVHYVLAMDGDKPVIRPALVVRVWNPTLLNLQVFTDGDNDDQFLQPSERSGRDNTPGKATRCIVWRTTVIECAADAPEVGRWFWPPYV